MERKKKLKEIIEEADRKKRDCGCGPKRRVKQAGKKKLS